MSAWQTHTPNADPKVKVATIDEMVAVARPQSMVSASSSPLPLDAGITKSAKVGFGDAGTQLHCVRWAGGDSEVRMTPI